MVQQGKFKRQLSLLDLTFLGLGAIIGSGWLFGALKGSHLAGPSAFLAWVIGAIAVGLIGLVYAELGGALPRTGGIIRYPDYSHGPLVGFMMGLAALIAYSSVAGIEAEAMRGYMQSYWHALATATGGPTALGWFIQALLLFIFFLLNFWSVNIFGKFNTVITAIKFIVPTATFLVLLFNMHTSNFTSHGFAPGGFTGIESAVSTAGIVFAFLGFRQAVDFAGEAKNPQRNVPLAIIMAIAIAAVLYILLQIAFIGAVPANLLSGNGWAGLSKATLPAPYANLMVAIGFGWMATIVNIDAIISPSGTGNIYLASTTRVVYAWAENGTFFKFFRKVSPKTGIPRPALIFTFLLALFWTLPFPSWDNLVNVVSSATVMTYVIGPVSAAAFRKTAPGLHRPFRLGGMGVVAPLAFVIASLIIYWTGWQTDSWLIGLQVLGFIVYVLIKKFMPTDKISFQQQLKSTWWLVVYYLLMMGMSYLGDASFQGNGTLKTPWDQIVVIIIALVCYYWGVSSAIPAPDLETSKDESVDVAMSTY